jgi:oligopeptidase B
VEQLELVAPVAAPRPHRRQIGNVPIDDPYSWLENPCDPAVIAHLEAENAYTNAVMEVTDSVREALYREIVGRVQRTDTQVPFRTGDNFYYTRTEEGRDYDILCRKQGSFDAAEEILLDLNEIAGDYLALGKYAPSYDHRYLAYALNETGGIAYTLYCKDMECGELLPERLPNDGSSFAWAADNRTLFYSRQDAALRSFEVWRHQLGTDIASDHLLYREDDPIFSVYVFPSDSKEFIFLYSGSAESSEVRYLRADDAAGELTLFAPRRPGVLYSLEHAGDDFLVLTNENAVNFTLLAVPVAAPLWENQRELIPYRERALLQDVDVFERRVLVSGREDGLSRLWVHDLESGETRPIEFDEPIHTVRPGDNREFHTTKAVVAYTSFVKPPSFFEVDLVSGERTLLKQEPVVGRFDPSEYVSERLFAAAEDGAQVPISLVRRRDAPAGPRPLLLRGYGSYGFSYDPRFARNELSLIDRGITFAIAHVRGGQELGRRWYEDGKLLHKKNTFGDFIACAEHLIAHGYTTSDRLIAQGGSAGGLLMGAVANERPEIFRTIVAEVPFVDVVRVMLDPSLPLTSVEFVEWGDPRDPAFYTYIRSYSPYDNVGPRVYPNLYLTAGIEDDQVPYWQPAKWAAKLRAMKRDDNLLLLRTNMGAGHAGASGFYDHQREVAFTYAFVLLSLGILAPGSDDGPI